MEVYVSCPKYPLYYKCKIYEKIVEELKKSGPIGCLLVLLSTLLKKKGGVSTLDKSRRLGLKIQDDPMVK